MRAFAGYAEFLAAEIEQAVLEAQLQAIRRNSYLPSPPSENNFVGDGDFHAIGCEFLRHFAELGGLRPQHSVLEIGCGIGRMALPLTQFLAPPAGRYTGFDVVAHGIEWCSDNITRHYPNFEFHHLDFHNQFYNPDGVIGVEHGQLPFPSDRVDFLFMTSVMTHLDPEFAGYYLAEAARLLRDGGVLFITAFLLDSSNRRSVATQRSRPGFRLEGDGPAYFADPENPMAAVAFDADWLVNAARGRGLVLHRPVAFGHWSGRVAGNFQDICVFRHNKTGRP